MSEDAELISLYIDGGSEAAFTKLVQRYADLVYSAALRLVGGDAHLAEDVSQMVFVEMARQARSLSRRPVLSGWLHTVARFTAAKVIRCECRRKTRELGASPMLESSSDEECSWDRIRPVLDEAVGQLKNADREAVLLRYFERRDFATIGATLGLSENAARMRVERALERLRALLTKRGIHSTAAGLAATLTAWVMTSAPSGLAAQLASASVASNISLAPGSTAFLKVIAMNKIQVTVVGAILLTGTAVLLKHELRLRDSASASADLRAQLGALQQQLAKPIRPEGNADGLSPVREAEKQLRAENLRLGARLADLLRKEAETAKLKSDLEREKQAFQASDSSGRSNMMATIEGFKSQAKLSIQAKMSRMRSALRLTSQQEQAIQEILMEQALHGTKVAEKVLGGNLQEEMAETNKVHPNIDEQIKALLTPEQWDGFQQFKAEERASEARAVATRELVQMQNALNLTQDQQDKVYAVLFAQSSQSQTPPKDRPLTSWLQQRADEKVKALEGILSAEQVAALRQMQDAHLRSLPPDPARP